MTPTFAVLGALVVERDGAAVEVGGGRLRSLLGLLVVSRNRAVSVDALADALWAGSPPRTARTVLQGYVSQLRKLLGPVVVTEGGGYRLAVEDEAVDAVRFERLLGERRFEEALALWRGPPLADFAFESWAQPEIGRLEELRVVAREELAEAWIAAGRHAEAVPELEALLAQQPLRERPRALLMTALYRSGRQAGALDAYQQGRALLVEELGIDPGPELQSLHRAILNQDPALAPPSAPAESTLPAPPTPLVGRERELERLVELVTRQDVRLVTLTGPGGIGKTRLALETARSVPEHVFDGAFAVALGPVRDPALALPTVAAAVGVRESGSRPLEDRLAEHFARRRVLLFLDNVEQLVEIGPDLGRLLERCAGLTLLVTSRERLHLSAEHEYPLSPLTEAEAVRLFHERARTVAPGMSGNGEVPEICRRLDCLPLAVELAAARAKLLSPRGILDRLERTLPLLTGGPRDAPERQRALRTTIDWSYELLPEDERELFLRLAVFAGGFRLEAAEEAVDADLDALASLVDKSLLRRPEADRFTMLQTIREYALDRLGEAGEGERVRERHAAYFLALAEEAEPQLHGSDQVAAFDRLEAEHDNLRAALAWSLERDPAVALRLAAALGAFFEVRGHLTEGGRWLEQALAADAGPPAPARAWALIRLARLVEEAARFEEERTLNEQALTLFRELGDEVGIATALRELAWSMLMAGDHDRARAYGEESVAVARNSGDRWALSGALSVLAGVVMEDGDHERAVELDLEGLELRRELGDRRGVSGSLLGLGWATLLHGESARAAEFLRECSAAADEVGDRVLSAYALSNLGLALLDGDLDGAEAHLRRSLALATELGITRVVEESLHGLAGVAAERGDFERFARLSGAADGLRRSIGTSATPIEQGIDERYAPGAREALGDEAFAAAFAEGARLGPAA